MRLTTELDGGPQRLGRVAERTCVVTRTVRPVEEMIRFVVGPEGAVVPDLKRKLPGRGVWVSARARPPWPRRSSARRSPAASGARSRCRPTSPAGRGAARARRARCAGDRPQGRAGRSRVYQGRGRAERGTASSAWSTRRMPARTGCGRSGILRRRWRGAGVDPDHRRIYFGAIGFGIGPAKCDTCCPACGSASETFVARWRAPRRLPDRRSRAKRAIATRRP